MVPLKGLSSFPDLFFRVQQGMKNSVTIYGIRNCDTMKKAFTWLDKHKVAYTFHDYKKSGADSDVLKRAFQQHGWENTLNRKGMTWRNLPENTKSGMTEKRALEAALENPSVIKRPLITCGKEIILGFDEKEFGTFFL
jgi:arsenate reductase